MKFINILVFVVVLSSCAHSIHDVYTSDYGTSGVSFSQDTKIESYAEQFAVLGFVTETNYLNQAQDKLLAQCTNDIVGITTEYWTSLGFFSWTNKIRMQGYCKKS